VQAAGVAAVARTYTQTAFTACVGGRLAAAAAARRGRPPPPPPERSDRSPQAPDGAAAAAAAAAATAAAADRHSLAAWRAARSARPLAATVTVGIKSHPCDASVVGTLRGLLRSIRSVYPDVRVVVANDAAGVVLAALPWFSADPHTEELRLPADVGISAGRNALVDATSTPYLLLVDDDHVFDEQTDLAALLRAADTGGGWDVVGVRVRNLPGMAQMEAHLNAVDARGRVDAVPIPRYVANVTRLAARTLTLCVWNENRGPSVAGLTVPLRVDVVHNALLGRVAALRASPWRPALALNEHMTFFLDARAAGLTVGYLPSVFVHHRPRPPSACYGAARGREADYERLLDYNPAFVWDHPCHHAFPARVRAHVAATAGGRTEATEGDRAEAGSRQT